MLSTRIRQAIEAWEGLVAVGLAVLGFLIGKWAVKGDEPKTAPPMVERPLPGQACRRRL